MTTSKATLERNAVAPPPEQQARFGHDPLDVAWFHRGELLDAVWEEEFDRRLAAWEAESPAVAPVEVEMHQSSVLPR